MDRRELSCGRVKSVDGTRGLWSVVEVGMPSIDTGCATNGSTAVIE